MMKILKIALLLISINTTVFASQKSESIPRPKHLMTEKMPKHEKSLVFSHYFQRVVLKETDVAIKKRESSHGVGLSKLQLDLHTLAGNYYFNDIWALNLGMSYIENSIQLKGSGFDLEANSAGMGDSTLGAIYYIEKSRAHNLFVQTDISLPTGSIDKESDGYRLAYSSQLSSGTYDLTPQIKYYFRNQKWNAGAKAKMVVRTGRNKHGYRLGNRTYWALWGGFSPFQRLSLFSRLKLRTWGGVDDHHADFMTKQDSWAKRSQRFTALAGTRLSLSIFKGARLALEVAAPYYQWERTAKSELDTDWQMTTTLQVAL